MKRVKTWLCIALSALLLIGCGGGGDPASGDARTAGVGSGGTGAGSGKSYAAGVISGSTNDIVVNGIHFETEDATVEDVNSPELRLTPGDLQPGMMVEIDAGAIEQRDGMRVAKAVAIRISSQVRGTIFGIEGNTVYVLGMRVYIVDETRFDASLPEGLAGLRPGEVIEVHGFLDTTNSNLVATLVSRKSADSFFVQGMVVDLVDQAFQLAGLPFLWQETAAGLSSGRIVQLKFPASLLAMPTDPESMFDYLMLTANITIKLPSFEGAKDAQLDAYLDGLVTSIDTENSQRFWLNNVEVDASQVKGMTCLSLRTGDRVRVRGLVVKGKVYASKVDLIEAMEPVSAASAASEAMASDVERATSLACDAARSAPSAE